MPDILINVTQLAQKLGLSRQTVHTRKAICERQDWKFEDLLPRPADTTDWVLAPHREEAWLAKRPLRRVV